VASPESKHRLIEAKRRHDSREPVEAPSDCEQAEGFDTELAREKNRGCDLTDASDDPAGERDAHARGHALELVGLWAT
jgi:hypothetical protein